MESNIIEIQNNLRGSFIKARTALELRFNPWIKKFEVLSPEEKIAIGLPEGCTLSTLWPELYKDIPDKDIYKQQFESLKVFVEKLNAKARETIANANQILEEYNAINSR